MTSGSEKIKEIQSFSPEDTFNAGFKIAQEFPRSLILLNGQLGAGKTHFARGFTAGIGIEQQVSSPSYTLVNEYRSAEKTVYHMDLYRINCFEEVVDIGLFEILEAGDPCLIEWAEKLNELTFQKHVLVSIKVASDEKRTISYQEKEGKKA